MRHDGFPQTEYDVSIVVCTKDRVGLLDQMLGNLKEAADDFDDFTYSKKSHFALFKGYDVELYGKSIDPDACDLKAYQDLLVFSFIKENIPRGSRILDISGGKSRILNYFKNNYECWNLDKLEGLGNGPIAIDSEGYRLVKDYIGCFNKELPDNYFDFVFSISALEHVPEDDEGYFKNIRDDIDRILKPGGYSLHCFDVVMEQDSVWTNKLLPFLFKNLETAHPFIPLEELDKDSDLYCMSKQAYSRHWEHTTKRPYEEFGKPLSYNIMWKKALKFTPIIGKSKQKDKHSLPKISVVTPSFNQADYLEECIDSILGQNYPNLEYIIMDGGSTDGSVEIIKKYAKYLTYWQSRPDGGQYAAINEGFKRTSGEIMTWLNSDDKHHSDSLFKTAYIFEKYPDLEWMTGRPTAWNDKGELILVFDYLPLWSREKYLQRFFKKICIQQESTFWKRSLWEKAGARLRTDLQFAGDLELWVRFFRHAQLFTVDTLLGGYRYQANQKTNLYLDKYMQEGDRIIDREIADIKRNELTRMLPAPRPISFDRKEFQGYKKNFSFKVNDAHLVGAGNEPEAVLDVQAPLRRTAQDIRCRGDFKIGENTPLTIATSIAPKELEKQIKAIESWIRIGFDVVSINCREEIGILQESFPDVKFVQARRDARKTLGKPFVYLDDFLKYFQESDSEFCSIVNSDIRLVGDEGIISFIKEQAKDSIVYGSRIDVDSSEALNGRAYNKGFDFFFFHKSPIFSLPETDFCIGAPWWDYWLPLIAVLNGMQVKKLVSPFAYHLKHPWAWDQKRWFSLGKKFYEYLREIICEKTNSPFINNARALLGEMISAYAYHLLPGQNMENKDKATIQLCENSVLGVLKFLEVKSVPISYSGGFSKPRTLSQIKGKLQTKLIKIENTNIQNWSFDSESVSRADNEILVSLILPTKDRPDGLENVLRSIPEAMGDINYEILMYTDEEKLNLNNLFEKYNITKIFYDHDVFGENGKFSWPKLINHGFAHSSGRWVMYGSDDIVFYPSCFKNAVLTFLKQKDDLIGGLTFLHRNTVETHGEFFKDFGYDTLNGDKAYINFGLIRKDVFSKTNGFDENLKFFWADVDICMRIWKQGFKVIPSYFSLVDHNNVLDKVKKDRRIEIFWEDTECFYNKWSGDKLFMGDNPISKVRFFFDESETDQIKMLLKPKKAQEPDSIGGGDVLSKDKIVIDGVIFQLQRNSPGGISRVWTHYLEQLARSDIANNIVFLDRENTAPKFPGIRTKVIQPYCGQNAMHRQQDALCLQQICEKEGASLFISTYYTYPKDTTSILMLHDFVPEVLGWDLSENEWQAKSEAINKASHYLSISNNTLNDFRKFYREYEDRKASTIYNAASDDFRKNSAEEITGFRRRYDINKPYFILVGHRWPHKNTSLFVKAFSSLKAKQDYEILFTGGNSKLEEQYLPYLQNVKYQLLYLSDRELSIAYSGALALVYPSLYEGFGMPVLEAMKSGCPVITCNNSSIPEIAEEAAIYVAEKEVLGMKKALVDVQRETIRKALVNKGYDRAKLFSWESSGNKLINYIKELLPLKQKTCPRTFERIQQKLDNLKYCQKFVLDKNEMVRPIPGGQTDVKLKQMGECFPASFHGKRFLEVGANKGFFTMLAAKRGASQAVALEPRAECVQLMEEIKRYFKLENFEPVQESFGESIKKYGPFDIVFVGSVYHYIFLELRDHMKFFSMLSDITSDYVIFEGPTSLDDADLKKHCERIGQSEFMSENFTNHAILSAARRYFGQVEYVSKWMPARDIYIFRKRKQDYKIIKSLHKNPLHASETFLALEKDGKQICLKKSATTQCFTAIPHFKKNVGFHPFLVELHDYWIEDNSVYQVMEYLSDYKVLGDEFWQLDEVTKTQLINKIFCMELELLCHDLIFCDLSPSNFMTDGRNFKVIDLEGLVYIKGESENVKWLTTFAALTLTELIIRAFFDSKLTRNALMELFGLDTAFSYVVKESSLKKGLNILCDNYSGIQPFISDIEKIFLDWKYLYQPQLYRSLLDNIKSLIKPAGMVESRTDRAVRNHDREYLVSAVISTYNSDKFLPGCLDDLEHQTIADKLEIIVVNSNSEENEEAIVHEYQQKYNNIVYIKTEQREGIYTAWNRAIKIARGKFITNANTDDRHRSDAFEILSSDLEKHPDISLVYADCYVSSILNETYNENSKRHIYRYPDFLAVAAVLHDQFGPQPLWRKKIHETIGYFDGSYKAAGDHDFNIRFALHFKALHIAESLGLYLEHPGAISFRDDTLSQEQGRIAFTYSNAAIIEGLYKQVGIACDSPEEKARIHLDMGIRAMEYYPPWKTGKPECSLEFALKCFQRAVKLKPDWAAAHNNFAVVLGLGGNFQDAAKLLEQLSRRIQEPTINYNFKLISEVSLSRSAWSGAKLITSGLSLPSQRDLSLKQKWSEPPVESLIPLQPKGSSKSGNLKILFYFDRIGNLNESSPAGTVIAVLNFARALLRNKPQTSIHLTGDLVRYPEQYESFQVIPLPRPGQREQFLVDYDVVFFATHIRYFKGLAKPPGQIWVLWQHCWEADDHVSLSHISDFDIVICLSELHRASLRDQSIGNEKLITIPNLIDTDVYSPKALSRNNHSIMFAGGLNPHKCIHVLMDAFRLVRQQVEDAELHIYGDGQMWRGGDTYGNELKSIKPEGTYFHGYVDNKDMPQIYSKHSILCLPSKLESFGLVTVEAQACGCVPVVHNVGGVAATLADGQTGLLYSPNTPEKLAETIIKAIKIVDADPSVRQKAINFVRNAFSINRAAEYISKLWSRITIAEKINTIRTLLEGNEIEQADFECEKLLQKNPNHPDVQLLHALIMLQQGNEPKANVAIGELLENFPNHLRALNDFGLMAMKAGDTEKALRYLIKAYKFNPWDKDTITNCYAMLTTSGKYRDAKMLLLNYLTNVGENAQVLQLFREIDNLIANAGSGTKVVSQEVLNNRQDVYCGSNTSMPLVSIIMTVYNCAEYIGDAIESVLIQNYPKFELIIINDGSTDSTKEVISRYEDQRIRYFYQENAGMSNALNHAVRQARGQYIMPLDADDMMTADFIAKHLSEFEKHPDADLVYCDVLLIDENSKPIRIMNKPEYQDRRYLIRDLFRAGHPIVPFRLGIKRTVYNKIGLYDEKLKIGMDYDMMRRFVKVGLKEHHLSEPLHLRRMHADSLSGNQSAQKAKSHFEVIKRFTDTFTYDELFPDVAWDEIAPQMRQLHTKYLTAGTYLAIGQDYVKTNATECSRIAFDLACSELNDCVKMDPKNQSLRQLSQKFKLIRAKYTEAPQQVVS